MKKLKKIKARKLDKIMYLFWIFIFIIGIGDLFFVPYRSIVWFGSLIILIFLYRKFRNLPVYAHISLLFIVLANIFGEIFGKFFYTYTQYDKFLHFVNSILIAVFVYHIVKEKIKDKKVLALFCAFAAITVSAVWEIFEYIFDKVFRSLLQGVFVYYKSDIFGIVARQAMDQLSDTMFDMIFGIAGVIVFLIGLYYFNKRKKVKK